MAGSVNKAILVGNVGADPQIRTAQDGRKIANFSIATSESWKDKNTGERKDRTEWHRIVMFNENLAKVVEQYVKKGSKLYIEGALQTRKWTDQSGAEKYSTEVVLQGFNAVMVLLDRAEGGGMGGGGTGASSGGGWGDDDGGYGSGAGFGGGSRGGSSAPAGRKSDPFDAGDLDDDVPF